MCSDLQPTRLEFRGLASDSHKLMPILLCAIVFPVAAQSPPARPRPSPPPTPKDGFVVRCHWDGEYQGMRRREERGVGTEITVVKGAPLNGIFVDQCTVRLREEFNEATGQLRTVVEKAEWKSSASDLHWTNPDGSRVDAGSGGNGGGSFLRVTDGKRPSAEIRYFTDKHGVNMLSLSVNLEIGDDDKYGVNVGKLGAGRTVFETVVKGTATERWKPDIATPTMQGKFQASGTVLSWSERRRFDAANGYEKQWIWKQSMRPVKLELTACPADWVPEMGGRGTNHRVGFVGRVVDPPGLAVRWRFRLENVSKLPGACNNANLPDWKRAEWGGNIPDNFYDLLFDYRRYAWREPDFIPPEKPWQVLTARKPKNSEAVEVTCLDFGASGRLAADGEVDGLWWEAKVKDTGERFARIPFAKNEAADDRIADAARPSAGDSPYPTGTPADDKDRIPAGAKGCDGDGLTVFEEYRGFVVRDLAGLVSAPYFVRLDPARKDLFVLVHESALALAKYLPDFKKAARIGLWRIGNDNLTQLVHRPGSRIVNFNREPRTGRDQHGLLLMADENLTGSINGMASNFGPPKYVNWVKVAPKRCAVVEQQMPNFTRRVVIHELGHGVGFQHHGDTNRGWPAAASPELALPIAIGSRYYAGVAIEGGQNSGDEACAMKYVRWNYYLRNRPGSLPTTYTRTRERAGLSLCTSRKGTGINLVGSRDWHCGNATRGNCMAQLRISDACSQAARGEVSGSGDAGGGWGGADDEWGGGTIYNEAESSASQTRREAGVALTTGNRMGREPITPGTPVVVDVQLHGVGYSVDKRAPLRELGDRARPWRERISLWTVDREGRFAPAPLRVRTVGEAMDLRLPDVADTTASLNSLSMAPGSVLDLTTGSLYSFPVVVDTSTTPSLSLGSHRFFVGIDARETAAAEEAGPRLLSDSVLVQIADPAALTPDLYEDASWRRTLAEANARAVEKDLEVAERLAREAVATRPDRADARVLLAEILELRGKLLDAHEQYQRALAIPQPSGPGVPEPPDHLLFALSRIEERLSTEPLPLRFVPDKFVRLEHESPLTSAALVAVRRGDVITTSPFPADLDRLAFAWELSPGRESDPLGARWVAVETGGVAPPDHVIATEQSDPGRASGEFVLTRPTAGFPAGTYRLEIWQAGRQTHVEEFEISAAAPAQP